MNQDIPTVDWFLVSTGQADKVGEVDWLGEIYNDVKENFSDAIWVKDSDNEVHVTEDWTDNEPPNAVYESLRPKDPRQYLINCFDYRIPETIVENDFVARNQVAENNRRIVLMDSFKNEGYGSIEWSRDIVDITDPKKLTRYSSDARISYDYGENDFQEVAESIAEKKLGKNLPMVEEVMEYRQRVCSDNPDRTLSELDNVFNRDFLQQELDQQFTY